MKSVAYGAMCVLLILLASPSFAGSNVPEAKILHAPNLVRDLSTRVGKDHIAPAMELPKGRLYVKVLKQLNIAGNCIDIVTSLARKDSAGASEVAILWVVGATGPAGAGAVTTYLVVAVGAETIDAAIKALEEWTTRVFRDQACFAQATRAENHGVKAWEAYKKKDKKALLKAQREIIRATKICPIWWRGGYNVGYLMDSQKILDALALSLEDDCESILKKQTGINPQREIIKEYERCLEAQGKLKQY